LLSLRKTVAAAAQKQIDGATNRGELSKVAAADPAVQQAEEELSSARKDLQEKMSTSDKLTGVTSNFQQALSQLEDKKEASDRARRDAENRLAELENISDEELTFDFNADFPEHFGGTFSKYTKAKSAHDAAVVRLKAANADVTAAELRLETKIVEFQTAALPQDVTVLLRAVRVAQEKLKSARSKYLKAKEGDQQDTKNVPLFTAFHQASTEWEGLVGKLSEVVNGADAALKEEPSSLEASMVGWLGGLDVPGGTTATDSERARVWMGGEPKPAAQQQTAAPAAQEQTAAPAAQEQTAAPAAQEQTTVPAAQEQTAAPAAQEQTAAPAAQEQTTAPTAHEQTAAPTAQEQTAVPAAQEQTATTVVRTFKAREDVKKLAADLAQGIYKTEPESADRSAKIAKAEKVLLEVLAYDGRAEQLQKKLADLEKKT